MNEVNPLVIEAKLNALRELLFAELRGLRAEFQQRLDGDDRATAIQTAELARRLADLNHAHAQAQADREKYALREVVENNQRVVTLELRGLSEWRASVATLLAGFAERRAVTVSIGLAAISVVVSVVLRLLP